MNQNKDCLEARYLNRWPFTNNYCTLLVRAHIFNDICCAYKWASAGTHTEWGNEKVTHLILEYYFGCEMQCLHCLLNSMLFLWSILVILF